MRLMSIKFIKLKTKSKIQKRERERERDESWFVPTYLFDCLTIALPTELIHSSFSLSESAIKNIVSLYVDSSKAWALFITSSAPLTDKHLCTSITPRGIELWRSCRRFFDKSRCKKRGGGVSKRKKSKDQKKKRRKGGGEETMIRRDSPDQLLLS